MDQTSRQEKETICCQKTIAMAGCGYVCPLCGGNKIDDQGNDCNWCIVTTTVRIPEDKTTKDEEIDEANLFMDSMAH